MTGTDKHYPKPVYVVAGAGEVAVDRIRKLPEAATRLRDRVQVELQKIDLTDVRGRVQHDVAELPGKVRSEFDHLSDRVKGEVQQLRGRFEEARRKGVTQARTDAEKFRGTAEHAMNDIVETAQRRFKAATRQVAELYEGLASRGAKVLGEEAPARVTIGSAAPNPVTGQAAAGDTTGDKAPGGDITGGGAATGGRATTGRATTGRATTGRATRTANAPVTRSSRSPKTTTTE